MPRITINEDVNINVDEFLRECDNDDFNEIIEVLVDDGFIKKTAIVAYNNYTANESIFEEALDKLHGKYHNLSKFEEEMIISLSKKF